MKLHYVGGQSSRRAYLSRWKLILREYSALRARLYNSSELLEETKLALYTINQTTLVSDHMTTFDKPRMSVQPLIAKVVQGQSQEGGDYFKNTGTGTASSTPCGRN